MLFEIVALCLKSGNEGLFPGRSTAEDWVPALLWEDLQNTSAVDEVEEFKKIDCHPWHYGGSEPMYQYRRGLEGGEVWNLIRPTNICPRMFQKLLNGIVGGSSMSFNPMVFHSEVEPDSGELKVIPIILASRLCLLPGTPTDLYYKNMGGYQVKVSLFHFLT